MSDVDSVKGCLEQGNQYAAQRQWANAATSYDEALEKLCNACLAGQKTVGCSEGLEGVLRKILKLSTKSAAGPIYAQRINNATEDGKLLYQLRKMLAETFYNSPEKKSEYDELIASNCITAHVREGSSCATWTIVYHSVSYKRYSIRRHSIDNRVHYIRSDRATFPFVLRFRSRRDCDVAQVAERYRARFSYAWAHLADALCCVTMDLYRTASILIAEDVVAMFRDAYSFQVALAIDPQAPWALAHLGEFYRNVANGWGQPHRQRLSLYIRAVHYFLVPLGLLPLPRWSARRPPPPATSWTWAHLGATIVNVRAFVGDHKHEIHWCGGDTLSQLAKIWKLNDAKGLMKKANECLVNAQRGCGFFYPWAQFYQGGALMLMTLLNDEHSDDKPLAQLAAAQMLHATVLQLELATDLFEPGRLFRNNHIELGVFFFLMKHYSLAWQHAWIGLQYLFKFDFVHGVQPLLCTVVMALAARGQMRVPASARGETYELIKNAGFEPPTENDLPVPVDIITTRTGLVDFVESAFDRCGVPTLRPILYRMKINEAPNQWPTTIRVGVTTTWHTLRLFIDLLVELFFDILAELFCMLFWLLMFGESDVRRVNKLLDMAKRIAGCVGKIEEWVNLIANRLNLSPTKPWRSWPDSEWLGNEWSGNEWLSNRWFDVYRRLAEGNLDGRWFGAYNFSHGAVEAPAVEAPAVEAPAVEAPAVEARIIEELNKELTPNGDYLQLMQELELYEGSIISLVFFGTPSYEFHHHMHRFQSEES